MKPFEPGDRQRRPDDIPDDRSSNVAHLFREHNRVLVSYLYARLKNEQEAKEVAQEAYVKVLQLEQKPGAASFLRSYLFRVAENLAFDRIRRRNTRLRLEQLDVIDDLFEVAPVERTAIAEEELALLRRSVTELPDKYREAFYLHKIEDMSTVEVGERMGITDRMVRKYVSRALVYIRLRQEGHSPADAWETVKS